jgi:phospholipid transport system substrate-binding protein
MRRLKVRGWLCFAALLTFIAPRPARGASAATEFLKAQLTSLQQVLRDPSLADAAHRQERRNLERVILLQLFDFDEMARRALGSVAAAQPDRLREFTPLFIDFLEHSYLATLEENGDAEIRYGRETVEDDLWISTQVTLRDTSEYRVYYRLHLGESGWRVTDLVVESVSLVENYRAQFERFLRQNSFDQLLQVLRSKREAFD